MKRRLGFSTRAVHGDPETRPDWAPVVLPLYQSTTFTNPLGSTQEVIYTRYGNNPNHVAIAKRLALLEGGEAALFVGSGMGAVALTHLAVLRPGDHLLSSEWVYGGVHQLFSQEFGRFGIEVTFVNPLEPRTWKRALKKNTRAIFVETPTNPLLRVIDIEPIATLCQTEGLALVVDSTFATPLNFRPLEHGADVVIHSATKYLGGHSDLIGGAITTDRDDLHQQLAFVQNAVGAVPGPLDAWLVLRGLKTLAVRMREHERNATMVAEFLARHPRVTRVLYPGLPDYPQRELARRQMSGFGGMLSFELAGGLDAAQAVVERTRLFTLAESLGGVESLIELPAAMTHASIPAAVRQARGVADSLIRLSVGIEEATDLIRDLDQALR